MAFPATDAYLIAHWPAVVKVSRARWTLTIVTAAAGTWTVTIDGTDYDFAAGGGDDEEAIRNGLALAAAVQLLVTVSPNLTTELVFEEIVAGSGVSIAATAPGGGALTLVQDAPTDNAAFRQLWLDAAECEINACEWGCTAEMGHAALAAHFLTAPSQMTASGSSPADGASMSLGPASLTKAQVAAKTVSDSALGTTEAGRLFLFLQPRHVVGGPFCV